MMIRDRIWPIFHLGFMEKKIVESHTLNIHWFPGHMNKALKKIKDRLDKVDLVLEVRDARAPLLTSSPALLERLGDKPRVIILNKTDLADAKVILLWKRWFKISSIPFLFIDAFEKRSIVRLLSLVRSLSSKKKNKDDVCRYTKHWKIDDHQQNIFEEINFCSG